jgi:hypothetical protein
MSHSREIYKDAAHDILKCLFALCSHLAGQANQCFRPKSSTRIGARRQDSNPGRGGGGGWELACKLTIKVRGVFRIRNVNIVRFLLFI